jgi:hypothetical protein
MTTEHQRWARIRADRQRRYHSTYHWKWFRVYDRHPDGGPPASPGYFWVETPAKVQAMEAEDLEIQDWGGSSGLQAGRAESQDPAQRRGRDDREGHAPAQPPLRDRPRPG